MKGEETQREKSVISKTELLLRPVYSVIPMEVIALIGSVINAIVRSALGLRAALGSFIIDKILLFFYQTKENLPGVQKQTALNNHFDLFSFPGTERFA